MPTLFNPVQASPLPRHFIPDEEWEKLRLLVPGFSQLEAADGAAHRSRKEKKRPTSRAYTLYKEIESITETPKLGRSDTMSTLPQISIKLRNGQGEIVLMPQAQVAYVYHGPNDSPNKTRDVAQSLMVAAGWHTPESVADATLDQGAMQRPRIGLRVRTAPVEAPVSIASKKPFSYSLDQVRAHLIAERKEVLKAYQAYKTVHGEDGLRANPYLAPLREQATTLRTIEMLQAKGVHWAGYNIPGQGSKQFSANIAFLATIVQEHPEIVPTGNSIDALKQINSIIKIKRQFDEKLYQEQIVRVAEMNLFEEARAKAASAALKKMTINTAPIVNTVQTEKKIEVNVPPPLPLKQKVQTQRPRFGAVMSWVGEQMQKIKKLGKKPAIALGVMGTGLFVAYSATSPVTRILLGTALAAGSLAVGTGCLLMNMRREDKNKNAAAKQPKATRMPARSPGMALAT